MQLSNEVKTWRAVGIGILIAFFGLTLSLLTFQNNLYRELRTQDARLDAIRQAETAAGSKLTSLDERLVETRDAVRQAESRVKNLEQRNVSSSKKAKAPPTS